MIKSYGVSKDGTLRDLELGVAKDKAILWDRVRGRISSAVSAVVGT
jgi:hypothetical protein